MSLVFGQDVRLGLLSPETVTEGRLHHDLVEDRAIVEFHRQRVGDGAESRVVIVSGELWILDTLDLLSQRLDEGRRRRLAAICVVRRLEPPEHEHHGAHVLDAVVTVRKVVHGLELLVDDADTGLVGSACDTLDVDRRLAHLLKLLKNLRGRLDRCLRVEFRCIHS